MMKWFKSEKPTSFSDKLNGLLTVTSIILFMMIFRVWHLSIVQHNQKLAEAYKPQIRSVLRKVNRATIVDRDGITLAINKPQYNVTISYGLIRDLPARIWKKNSDGTKTKIFVRQSYITCLAQLLAKELNIDRLFIEDIIKAKASVLGNIPCLIKEGISEKEYYRIKSLEKDWPGLNGEIASRRYYPLGKIAGDVIGHIGPISRSEYNGITQKLSYFREFVRAWEEGEDIELPKGCINMDEVCAQLDKLEKASYGIHDLIGKAGIENTYDTSLRGMPGKRHYLIDRRGNFIRELEKSSAVVPGNKLILSLSSELQEFAERLLLEHESGNSVRTTESLKKKNKMPPLVPWIKGGAVIALDPNTGDVLAMASSPRHDPNDFVSLKRNDLDYVEDNWGALRRWLETEEHIAEIYDFKKFLIREKRDSLTGRVYDECLELNLGNYLDLILSDQSSVKQVFKSYDSLAHAVFVQRKMKRLTEFFFDESIKLPLSVILDGIFGNDDKHIRIGEICSLQEKEFFEKRYAFHYSDIEDIVVALRPVFDKLLLNYDKLLLTDLYRLIISEERMTSDLLSVIGDMSLAEFRQTEGCFISVRHICRSIIKDVFCERHFSDWRNKHFAEHLSEYRRREVAAGKKYSSPYTDCLDQQKRRLFEDFWTTHEKDFILFFLTGCSIEEDKDMWPYFNILSIWRRELAAGAHTALHWHPHYIDLKKHLAGLPIENFEDYFKLFREFSELTRPLLGKYSVSIVGNKPQLEKDLAALFYPSYGYGYLRSYAFRQATTIGSIFKVVSGYSALAQRYVNIQNTNEDLNPLVVFDCKSGTTDGKQSHVGFFSNGNPIPLFYKGGRLPKNDFFGRGSLDLIRALEMSSNSYFALLAGDVLEDPEDLSHAALLFGFGEKTGIDLPGEYPGKIPEDITYNRSGLYAMAIGQHSLVVTPLQTATMLSSLVNGGNLLKPRIVLREDDSEVRFFEPVVLRKIFLPKEISDILKRGMHRVINGEYGTARFVKQMFSSDLLSRVIGKTSTAEVMERVGLDLRQGVMKLKHIGFAAASFEDKELSRPDLVVVVYLRYGEFGRDAAPLALKLIEKWESMKKRNNFCCFER
ncbi:MAG: penicillin-binding transpeptidase domain-containing protein [Victivallaceae bacterium]